MEQLKEMVYIVDDDYRVRESLSALLQAYGKNVELFSSGQEFLQYQRQDDCACLLLDLSLPNMSGLEVQQQAMSRAALPVIFITGRGDVPSSVQAMKGGAIDFLTKPLDEVSLLAAIDAALAKERLLRSEQNEQAQLRSLYRTLTPREQQVLSLLVKGMLNKQAAGCLGITEYTVQVHRGHIMKKLRTKSFAALVQLASRLPIDLIPSPTNNA
ncbi:response regulator transcription factor [Undibacterium terreum]|uniref:DNA-binding response regulator n=1 Tax=Undibacterium terreum TaxID=1224302 RepID=A0A916XM87_9BURK|nr:response regulator [Undibacterium terreum]GGC85984.1 DNA-binding response regulator [Undibacterium terreum]